MSRMTFQANGKWCVRIGEMEHTGPLSDRLAAYENTGFEPDELTQLLKTIKVIAEHLPVPVENKPSLENVRCLPWQTLPLSARAFHCILHMRHFNKNLPIVETIGDLADLHYYDTMKIRNCGPVTRKEIASVLREQGIEKSGWYK